MNESVLLRFPPPIVRDILVAYRDRERTVWDARRLLSGYRDRWMKLEVDNGQYADMVLEGLFKDVLHHPQAGFSLLMRRLRTTEGAPETETPRALPLHLIRRVPQPFLFLYDPPSEWPLPEPAVLCASPECSEWVTGRFCPRCGALSRTGVGSRFPGEGFSAVQTVLQGAGMPRCSCGGAHLAADPYCEKCGRPVGEAEEA